MERPGSIPEEVRTSKLASDMVRGLVLGDRHKWIWTQISRLLIHMASTEHSGRYTCAPVDSSPASVHVHVLQGRLFCEVKFCVYIYIACVNKQD